MTVERKWTTGNIFAVITAAATLVTLVATIFIWGGEWGKLLERVGNLEKIGVQSAIDSRTLIQLQTDVAYIKEAVKDIRAFSASASFIDACPEESPIRVAAYCRSMPGN